MADNRTRDRVLNAVAVIATLCAIMAVGLRLHDRQSSPAPATQRLADWRRYGSKGQRVGPENAAVTIVEFADFQCPICRRASRYIDSLESRDPENIAVVFRHFPIHEYANAAAVAANCAALQGRFRNIARVLFQRPDSIGVASWTSFAVAAGVQDTVAFQACVANPASRIAVREDSAAGRALHISGTPTFIINDIEVAGFLGDSTMDLLVAQAKTAGARAGLSKE